MSKKSLSFEVFPPKKELSAQSALSVVDGLSVLAPDFISVTYGAGGSTNQNTIEVASYIQNEKKLPALVHMTCYGSPRHEMNELISRVKAAGLSRVLALRGDPPQQNVSVSRDFPHAVDLVRHIKKNTDFTVAAACYPEGHPECPDKELDLLYLKEKTDAGVDFLITQLFFDNAFFEGFVQKALQKGIKTPVLAGIMPVTNAAQITRIASMCCATIPADLQKLLYRYQDDPVSLEKAGIDYAIRQCRSLSGHAGLHLYTMNKPAIAREIVRAVQLRKH